MNIVGRPCKPIYKFDARGNLIQKFSDVTDASQEECVNPWSIYKAIGRKRLYKGFFYSFVENGGKDFSIKDSMPWEKGEMFDVEGWADVMRDPPDRSNKIERIYSIIYSVRGGEMGRIAV